MARLSDRLKHLRKENDMTQAEVAERIGVNVQTISQYERGVRRPDPDTLLQLSDLFNVSTDYILGRSDHTIRLVDENDLAKLNGELLLHDDHELHALINEAKHADPEDLKMATDFLRRLNKDK